MIASILILVVSLAMFVYWFRYTSLLILSAKPVKDYGKQVAEANQLGFLEVQEQLILPSNRAALEKLEAALSRDYKLLTSLLKHTPGFSESDGAFEHTMLRIDYRLMQLWYSAVRHVSESRARAALREMADIVAHFASSMGQVCAVRAEN